MKLVQDYSNTGLRSLGKPIKIIIALTLALILIGIIVFFVFNSIVLVKINGSKASSIKITAVTSTELKSVGGAGLIVVPRGTESLIVAADDYVKSHVPIHLPWFGITTISAQLNTDKNATKVAYLAANPACATYSTTYESLSSYSCQAPSNLQFYLTAKKDVSWLNIPTADLSSYAPNQFLSPYMGGVLGVTVTASEDTNKPGRISVVANNADKETFYDAPEGITSQTALGLKLFTNVNDPTDSRFVLVDAVGTIYLATVKDGKVTYTTAPAPESYSYTYNQTFCALQSSDNDTVYCLRSRNALEPPSGVTVADASVEKLSFAKQDVERKSVANAATYDNFYRADGDKLYAKYGNMLYSLTLKDGKYAAKQLAPRPNTVAAGDKLYFIQQNGVYAYDDKTGQSHQIFYSPNITLTGIYPVAGKVFAFGNTTSGGAAVYAYLLNNEEDKTPGKRMIDILPIPAAIAMKDVESYDFVGDRFMVKASSSVTDLKQVHTDFVTALGDRGVQVNKDNVTVIK